MLPNSSDHSLPSPPLLLGIIHFSGLSPLWALRVSSLFFGMGGGGGALQTPLPPTPPQGSREGGPLFKQQFCPPQPPSTSEHSSGAQTAGKLAARSDGDGSPPRRKYVLFIQFRLFPLSCRSYGDGQHKGIIFRAPDTHTCTRTHHRGGTMNQRASCLQTLRGCLCSKRQRQPPPLPTIPTDTPQNPDHSLSR